MMSNGKKSDIPSVISHISSVLGSISGSWEPSSNLSEIKKKKRKEKKRKEKKGKRERKKREREARGCEAERERGKPRKKDAAAMPCYRRHFAASFPDPFFVTVSSVYF